jgi:hypothetical protein
MGTNINFEVQRSVSANSAAQTCRRTHTVTVGASIPSVPAYQSFVSNFVGAEEEKQGRRYVRMQISINQHL